MRFSLPALLEAAAANIAPGIDETMRGHWAKLSPDAATDAATLSAEEAGNVLAAALTPSVPVDPAEPGSRALGVVELTAGSRHLFLTPEEAAAHPLLRGWVHPTFGAALGAILSGAGDLSLLAETSPAYFRVELIERPTGSTASVIMTFERTLAGSQVSAAASFRYAPLNDDGGLCTTRTLHGGALVTTGAQAGDACPSAQVFEGLAPAIAHACRPFGTAVH